MLLLLLFDLQTFMYDNDKASQAATTLHVRQLVETHARAAHAQLHDALCQSYGEVPAPLPFEWTAYVVHLLNAGVHAHLAVEWQDTLRKLNELAATAPWQPHSPSVVARAVRNPHAVRFLLEEWLEPWVFEQVTEHAGPLAVRLFYQLERLLEFLSTRTRASELSWVSLEEAGIRSRLACWWPLVKRTSVLYQLLHEGINRRMRVCVFHVRQAMVTRLSSKLRGVRHARRACVFALSARAPMRSYLPAHSLVLCCSWL